MPAGRGALAGSQAAHSRERKSKAPVLPRQLCLARPHCGAPALERIPRWARKPILSLLPTRGELPRAQTPGATSPVLHIAASAQPHTRPSAATPSAAAPSVAVAIKAVLVDMDDVLYDGSAWDRWLAQNLRRLPSRTLETDFTRSSREAFLPVVHRGQQEFHAGARVLPEGNRPGHEPCR